MKINRTSQTYLIARHLVRAYPQGICSQGIDRQLALQLPRAIKNFKTHKLWNFGEDTIISVKCKHPGKTLAVDYTLSARGLELMQDYYKITPSGEPQPVMRQPWEIEAEQAEALVSYEKDGRIYYDTPENVAKKMRGEQLSI